MPHQGSIYLDYNLVLLVQPLDGNRSNSRRLEFDPTQKAIKAHARLHLFLRFCKDNNGNAGLIETLVDRRLRIVECNKLTRIPGLQPTADPSSIPE